MGSSSKKRGHTHKSQAAKTHQLGSQKQRHADYARQIKSTSNELAGPNVAESQELDYPSGVASLTVKLNRIANWQAALVMTILGFAIFFTGLSNPFQGDDQSQIVDNPVVQSISHIKLFFEGSTFYQGEGVNNPLVGGYYRPLMTTTYSLIYTFFHLNTLPYHLTQVVLCIAGSFLLYLVLRYFFNPLLALVLSLIFLAHPINSQVAFAIPAMQDALYLFFGMLAFWLLLRFKSARSLWFVALSLLLCVLSKEAGLMFFGMALLYLGLFDRNRFWLCTIILALPIIFWLALRAHAVGLVAHSSVAPIDNVGLGARLLTIPSIMSFYLFKFVFPWKLASGYYWVDSGFSLRNVLLPLIVDLVAIALVVCLGKAIKHKLSATEHRMFVFFAAWATLGMLTILQVFPLDMTACETWFRFSFVGILGMIGCVILAYQERIRPVWFVMIALVIVGVLGIRTCARGTDWSSKYKLAMHDISSSKEDYAAYNQVAIALMNANNCSAAMPYLKSSIAIHPFLTNYDDLGVCLARLGDAQGAYVAYKHALQYGILSDVYDNFGELSVIYGNQSTNRQYLLRGLHYYPHDADLWQSLALVDMKYGNKAEARAAIANAARYGDTQFYSAIMGDQ